MDVKALTSHLIYACVENNTTMPMDAVLPEDVGFENTLRSLRIVFEGPAFETAYDQAVEFYSMILEFHFSNK